MIINNLLVSYTDEGEEGSPVIIFIHGFPFNKSMWNLQVEPLKDDYRLIMYDIRGHGNSDAGIEVFSIDLFANDLIGLMDALKIDKAILCGLSMGGYIA
jgi:pimeloyl-ACP methyl ester carboxylesterase